MIISVTIIKISKLLNSLSTTYSSYHKQFSLQEVVSLLVFVSCVVYDTN